MQTGGGGLSFLPVFCIAPSTAFSIRFFSLFPYCFAPSLNFGLYLLDTADLGTEGVQTAVDVLVPAVDLVDVLDDAFAVGAHGGDQ